MSLGDDVAELRKDIVAIREKVAILWEAYGVLTKLALAILGAVFINILLALYDLLTTSGGSP